MAAPGVPEIARRQAWVFTARQAQREGWSPARIRRQLRNGTWVAVLGRGLTQAGVPKSPAVRGWATHLTVPDGVLSHLTAGELHGFPVPAPVVGHVIAGLHRSPPGLAVHRDQILAAELNRRAGLPVTSRQRTAIDCLCAMDWDGALGLWAWFLTRRILDAEALGVAARDRFGKRGNETLVRLLAMARSGAASVAEHRLHQLLRSAGLTGWTANARVHDAAGPIGVVDVLFPERRLVIEVDGFAAHGTRDRFVADRRRQNRIIAAGYTVLRITWDDLRDRPAEVIKEIQAVLASRSAVVPTKALPERRFRGHNG